MAKSRTAPVLAVPWGQPGDTAHPQGKVCLASHTLAAPSRTRGLPLPPPPRSGSQASPAPSQPSSHGNYTLHRPIHHGLAIFYQHLSPGNLTPAVTARCLQHPPSCYRAALIKGHSILSCSPVVTH